MRAPRQRRPEEAARVDPVTEHDIHAKLSDAFKAALPFLLYDPGALGEKVSDFAYRVLARGRTYGPVSIVEVLTLIKHKWIVHDPANPDNFRGNPAVTARLAQLCLIRPPR